MSTPLNLRSSSVGGPPRGPPSFPVRHQRCREVGECDRARGVPDTGGRRTPLVVAYFANRGPVADAFLSLALYKLQEVTAHRKNPSSLTQRLAPGCTTRRAAGNSRRSLPPFLLPGILLEVSAPLHHTAEKRVWPPASGPSGRLHVYETTT